MAAVRVRLNHELATNRSLLDHGLLCLIARTDRPVVPNGNAKDPEYRLALRPVDHDRLAALQNFWGLSTAAVIRAALLAASAGHLNPARLMNKFETIQLLKTGGHARRTAAARAHKVAAELFNHEGESVGFITTGTLQSLRHKDMLRAS